MLKKLNIFFLTCLIFSCSTSEKSTKEPNFAIHKMENRSSVYPNAKTGSNYMYNFSLPPAGTSTPWWPSWSPDGKSLAFPCMVQSGKYKLMILSLMN